MVAAFRADPLRNFKFRVLIDIPSDTGNTMANMGFMGVSGIAVQNELIAYREGGFNAQPLSAKILTRSGWKTMGTLEVGDRVIDPFGDESKVEGIFPKGERDVYRVTLRDGSSTLACDQHLWGAQITGHYLDRVIDTREMQALVSKGEHVWLPQMQPMEFDSIEELPLDPYLLGVLLSEGCLQQKATSFCQSDTDVSGRQMVERVRAALPDGVFLAHRGISDWSITTGPATTSPNTTSHLGRNPVTAALRDLGLSPCGSKHKFIPEVYKFASIEDRLALLQGIMDGDGSISETGRIQLTSASKQLRDDVVDLICSLGGRATKGVLATTTYTSPTQVEPKAVDGPYYYIGGAQMLLNPFYVEDKASRFIPKNAAYQRAVVSVESVGREQVQCIKVSADSHLYVTDDFIPTHNTSPHKMVGQTDFAPITLTRGLFPQASQNVYNWQKWIYVYNWGAGNLTPGAEYRASSITVYIMAHPWTQGNVEATNSSSNPTNLQAQLNTNTVKAAIRFYNAWPGAFALTDLNAGDNGILIQQMTLHHEGWEIFFDDQIPLGASGAALPAAS